MALGLVAYASFQQLMRASYARQDTRTPWIVNSAAVAVNIVLNFPLFAWLGVPGLALAHAVSYVFAAVIGGAVLRRQLGGLDGGRVTSSSVRIDVASVTAALTAWGVSHAVASSVNVDRLGGQLAQVGAAVTAGLIIYAALAAAFRLDEFRPLLRMVSGRFARRGESA